MGIIAFPNAWTLLALHARYICIVFLQWVPALLQGEVPVWLEKLITANSNQELPK